MSDYVREKVIRYPIEEYILEAYNVDNIEDLIAVFEDCPEFKSSPTKGYLTFEYSDKYIGYLDYVLNYEYGACEGDFGVVRPLNSVQQKRWESLFSRFIPDLELNKFRLARFCYYNGVDCPEYYDITPDLIDDDEWQYK